MSSIKVKFYSDPGHGWGAVKRKLIDELGIADKITYYSYQKGQTVYLEEDLDLATLATALALKGVTISYIEKNSPHKNSPIRGYEPYKA